MHDPWTVIWRRRMPWPWPRPKSRVKRADGKVVSRREGIRPEFLTLWHVDPESDGSDDSCGWFWPKLTKSQRSALCHLGYMETQQPWYQAERAKHISRPADAEALLRGALVQVAEGLGLKFKWAFLCRLACKLIHKPGASIRGELCLLPGWHTNFQHDDEAARKREAESFFCHLGRMLLAHKRPWWRHPRWHVRHWHLQIHPMQTLKRWLFSRCARCGKRFPWGYAPSSHRWQGGGPRWFRREPEVYHHDCSEESRREASTKHFYQEIAKPGAPKENP